MLSILRKQTMSLKKIIKVFNVVSSLLCPKKQFSSSMCKFKYVPHFKRSLPDYRTNFGSQYFPMSPAEITNETIKNYLSENSPETLEDWDEAKAYFFTEVPHISDVNYSSIVMNTLLNLNNITLGQSFMKYLEERNMKPNVLAYLQYFALCGKNVHICGQDEILRIFSKIQHFVDSSPIFDMKQGTYIVQGICGTDRWRTAFEYLKKIPSAPSLEIRNSLASAAIQHGDEALAWEIILKRFRRGEILGKTVIKNFLDYANNLLLKDKRKAESFLLTFFKHMEYNNLLFTANTAKLVEIFFQNHSSDWSVNYTKVSRTGKCEYCQRALKPAEISDTEFSVLEKNFLEKSLKKGDIFINTTTEEFKNFLSFLERHKPFHIVIDGLNVAYTTKKSKNPKNLAIQLLKIVERVSSRSRKVLVMGRKHMAHWPENIMRKIANRSEIFLTKNMSQDDPFTLYAALASGPTTYILTLDLMRDHMARLVDPNLIALFKKWQLSHQIVLTVDEDNSFKLTEPVRHSIAIQGNMEIGWHIPYDDKIIREPYEELNNWLCIKKL